MNLWESQHESTNPPTYILLQIMIFAGRMYWHNTPTKQKTNVVWIYNICYQLSDNNRHVKRSSLSFLLNPCCINRLFRTNFCNEISIFFPLYFRKISFTSCKALNKFDSGSFNSTTKLMSDGEIWVTDVWKYP
jgi:hypothetical protein